MSPIVHLNISAKIEASMGRDVWRREALIHLFSRGGIGNIRGRRVSALCRRKKYHGNSRKRGTKCKLLLSARLLCLFSGDAPLLCTLQRASGHQPLRRRKEITKLSTSSYIGAGAQSHDKRSAAAAALFRRAHRRSSARRGR